MICFAGFSSAVAVLSAGSGFSGCHVEFWKRIPSILGAVDISQEYWRELIGRRYFMIIPFQNCG